MILAAARLFWLHRGLRRTLALSSYPVRLKRKALNAILGSLRDRTTGYWRTRTSARVGIAAQSQHVLLETGSLPEMLQRCVEVIVSDLGASFARIWTLHPEGAMLELRAGAGLYTHLDGLYGCRTQRDLIDTRLIPGIASSTPSFPPTNAAPASPAPAKPAPRTNARRSTALPGLLTSSSLSSISLLVSNGTQIRTSFRAHDHQVRRSGRYFLGWRR
jgi:hypothetical protein